MVYDNVYMRGILNFNKHPLYIAEYYGGDPTHSIAIYRVKEEKDKTGKITYDKDYTLTPVTNNPFSGGSEGTVLSSLAHSKFKEKTTLKKSYKLPIFVTTIVDGRDTFTGHSGPGFYEQKPGEFVSVNNKRTWEEGDQTGVFLCLDSFNWHEAAYSVKDMMRRAGVRNRSEESYFEF